ncbi:hypothetical protein KUW09_12985 [Mameliella alba]|nr:hypothetical protein [Antarctobacter heliothermus]MBY6144966.1 hypothetical protein [Mameliella alba]MCA0955956.1 hypothetical protein [Mameliella alba]
MIIENTPTAWMQSVKPGSIVAFRFPHAFQGEDRPKVRLTLVLDVSLRLGQPCATLCYGTTNPKLAATGERYLVDVFAQDEIAMASLRRPTRFHGSRSLLVSLASSAFDVSFVRQTAILGELGGESLERLHVVRARMQAELDIARAEQADRRRRRQPSMPRPFVVERRNGAGLVAEGVHNG